MLFRSMASLTSVNLSSNNLAGETGYVKADRVQGTSFEVGDKVTYEGREMIVSKGKDRDGDIRMIDGGQSGVKAIAEAIRVTASLTSIDLSRNNIRDEGAKALAPALRDSPSVTSVRASEIVGVVEVDGASAHCPVRVV